MYYLQEIHLTNKDTHKLKVKTWKRIFQADGQEKMGWCRNSYIDSDVKSIKIDEEHHVMIKRFHLASRNHNNICIYTKCQGT